MKNYKRIPIDVYKRQIEPTIEIMTEETIDKIGCAIRKGIKIAESSPKAVSYTHLDVYKRQV